MEQRRNAAQLLWTISTALIVTPQMLNSPHSSSMNHDLAKICSIGIKTMDLFIISNKGYKYLIKRITTKCYKPRLHYFVTDALCYSQPSNLSVILLSSYLQCPQRPSYNNWMQESPALLYMWSYMTSNNKSLTLLRKKMQQPSFWLWLIGNNSLPDPDPMLQWSLNSSAGKRLSTCRLLGPCDYCLQEQG